jgi:hypothetical protein
MIEIAYEEYPTAPIPASWVTPHIKDMLKLWAAERGWRSFKELRVPLRDARTFGRLDLVVFRERLPDLVIEIDSQNVERSVAKLELARDRGALPVWVRWHSGSVPRLEGIAVLDVIHETVGAG